MLEEEERQSVNAESLAEMFTEVREQKATEVAAAVAGDESEAATIADEVVTPGPEPFSAAPDTSRPERPSATAAARNTRRRSRPNRTAGKRRGAG